MLNRGEGSSDVRECSGEGPTASAYSTLTTSSRFTSTNNDVPVGQATITTTFTGRIVTNASLDVERTSGNGDVTCQLWIGPGRVLAADLLPDRQP